MFVPLLAENTARTQLHDRKEQAGDLLCIRRSPGQRSAWPGLRVVVGVSIFHAARRDIKGNADERQASCSKPSHPNARVLRQRIPSDSR